MSRIFRNLTLGLTITTLFTISSTAQIRPEDLRKDSKTWKEWGFVLGGNFEQITAYPLKSNYSNGPDFGVYYKKRNKHSGISIGLNVSTANYLTEHAADHQFNKPLSQPSDTGKAGDFTPYHINVPVILEYRPARRFIFQIGAALQITPSVNDNNGAFTKYWNTTEIVKPLNVIGMMGFEYELWENIRLAAHYGIGFMDVNNKKFAGVDDHWLVNGAQVQLLVRYRKWYPKHG